jgi:hypothetical protein
MAKVQFPRMGDSSGAAVLTGLPWTDAMLPAIQYAQDIHYGMVLVHPNMPPQQVLFTGATFTIAPITFTSPPAVWTGTNWPSAVEIWQSRLWLANTPAQPTELWASTVATAVSGANSYEDFATGTNPDDAIDLTLSTKGAIKWIRGKQNLLIGTELHEDIVVSQGAFISSQDAQLVRESGFGSTGVQAQDIGDQVLFVSRDAVKLRSLNFNFDTQAWLAHDISFYAQGITLPGILNIAYCRDPDNTIFVLCTNGTMRMCTYDRLQEVVAWSRWKTAGSVKDICATIDPTGTTLWMAVSRNGTTYIEVVPPYTAQTPVFLDSYTTALNPVIYNVGPIQRVTIPVEAHLNGFNVGVIIDGVYYGIQAVGAVTPNAVDIPYSGAQPMVAYVGLPYVATCITLPLDGGVMYGSSQGLVKSRTKIFVRLLPGSILPKLNGQRPSERIAQVTPMNTNQAVPDLDNWVVNLGWDRYARVEIVQDIPLETQVAGIFGRAEVAQN